MELDELVAARGDALLRFAYLLCGDAYLAEDLVQTVLARAYAKWRRVAAADRPEAYLKKMIVNEHLSWRRRRSSGEVVTAAVGDSAVAARDDAVADRDAVWRLLATLPRRQRAVLVLRYYEDLDDAAVAAALGCSESTVRSYASRGLAALRIDVEEAGRAR
ncbi:MAG TPA: SigE family RNA polymerase sigma factor [Mycobacteriales bacterium]|nr:SigE family RNA polymerase sigma factor [Mycobacteriales bacterium]